ncbi:NAD-dependent epimerase [Hylemonella gracilis]|uniref:NAD-dependent epimerase n=1 Tax=Hylemonella gracilis TaxID=80880 RepID=UPI0009DE4FEF|nr:NAD-dependent epimerase [Hylemonella gracilis]
MNILVTGAAGFIGFHLARKLLLEGHHVKGIDNLNAYYDPGLKSGRLQQLEKFSGFSFEQIDIADQSLVSKLFAQNQFHRVLHMAAQAGVRYSLENPHAYVSSNLVGFLNILEACRHNGIAHLVYASSSSVYGANQSVPFSENINVDHPVSLYAATKKSNELMAHSYSHLFGLPTTGLRFFTVYGPWGRPDMSPILFAQDICRGKPLNIFNYGKHKRDFTYVEDVVTGIVAVMEKIPKGNEAWSGFLPDPATSRAPWRIYNIGNNRPIELLYFIELLEKELGRSVEKNFLPMQSGDMESTHADVDALQLEVGYAPSTSIEEGLRQFVDWFKSYYKY